MPRKGKNIYKRKGSRWDGRCICYYDAQSKAKYTSVYGKTYSEVKQKLINERGATKQVRQTSKCTVTYNELLDSLHPSPI